MVSSKGALTEEQKARILSLKKPQPDAGPTPAAPAPAPAPATAEQTGGEHDDFIGQMDAAAATEGGAK